MAVERPARLFSYDDYAAVDDGRRYEVLDGKLEPMSAPSTRHQEILGRLYVELALFLRAAQRGRVFLAPYDVVLRAERPATVLQPDLVFVSHERRAIVTEANVQGAPDIVVEILSPSTARFDAIQKYALYERFGVPEVWFVPFEFDRVEVRELDGHGGYGAPTIFKAGGVLTSARLPGFGLAVDGLFEGPAEGGGRV